MTTREHYCNLISLFAFIISLSELSDSDLKIRIHFVVTEYFGAQVSILLQGLPFKVVKGDYSSIFI